MILILISLLLIYIFFQWPSARREDFKEVSSITNAASPYVLRHCQTRWLNIKKVLVRIIISNLIAYFVKELPKQKAFKGKNGVGSMDRYHRISKLLNKEALLAATGFGVLIYQDF